MKLVEAATLHQKSNDQHNEPVSSVGRNPPHDFPLDARNDSNGRLAAGSKAAAKKQAMSMIPPSKEGLMAYRVDNDLVSKTFLKRNILPWIRKKYFLLGNTERVTLENIITEKLCQGTSAPELIKLVNPIIGDRSEKFVIRLWRLLIYKTESMKPALQI